MSNRQEIEDNFQRVMRNDAAAKEGYSCAEQLRLGEVDRLKLALIVTSDAKAQVTKRLLQVQESQDIRTTRIVSHK